MKTPLSRNYNSFRDWIIGRKPLAREETTFIQNGDDFVALADGAEDGCFDGMVEDVLGWLPRSIVKVNHTLQSLQAPDLLPIPQDETRHQLKALFFRRYSLTKFQPIFTSAEQRKKTDDEYVHLYSKRRIDFLVRVILALVTVILLLVPTALLFLVPESNEMKIVTILLFTLLFSVSLMVFTKAKRHEMFAASAA